MDRRGFIGAIVGAVGMLFGLKPKKAEAKCESAGPVRWKPPFLFDVHYCFKPGGPERQLEDWEKLRNVSACIENPLGDKMYRISRVMQEKECDLATAIMLAEESDISKWAHSDWRYANYRAAVWQERMDPPCWIGDHKDTGQPALFERTGPYKVNIHYADGDVLEDQDIDQVHWFKTDQRAYPLAAFDSVERFRACVGYRSGHLARF